MDLEGLLTSGPGGANKLYGGDLERATISQLKLYRIA
jgi:hypothetical protein